MSETELSKTPLNDFHVRRGARMVPFAGYAMPVQYRLGVLKEHLHTRSAAGLFDVSHMGQVEVRSVSGDNAEAALALESLVVADVLALKEGRQRYALFTNDEGGILDDLMVSNLGDYLFLVVNAACKEQDLAHLRAGLAGRCEVTELSDRALLALQGPKAAAVLDSTGGTTGDMAFMDVKAMTLAGARCLVSRSGYTGEDGFEISVPAAAATGLAEALTAHADVEPIGLGARDSLRLEAGLCLYGHDIDTTTTPVEANLVWAIQKSRRAGGARAGGFPGAAKILDQIQNGPPRRRVGLRPEGRAPVRDGTEIFAAEDAAEPVGRVTSGGFGPSVGGPVSMGYVPAEMSAPGSQLFAAVRGKRLPVQVAALPFITPGYKR
ncbi:MAG: glycine cleavage system aminomethyltransferase GcvT [Paracoccaceae bacterium]